VPLFPAKSKRKSATLMERCPFILWQVFPIS